MRLNRFTVFLFFFVFASNIFGKTFEDYLIAADTLHISDNTKTLGGDLYGNNVELGADTKIYGNFETGAKCFLRERANISDTLTSSIPCARQNGIKLGKEVIKKPEYAKTQFGTFPASTGSLRVDARTEVRLKSGTYSFSNIHTEPDVKWHFDLTNGPIKIYVQNGIRFGDRNVSSIVGGNPSEIEWQIASGNVDIGTDGKYFGRFIAPNSYVRLAPRSHVVGGIEARKFQTEPQSTVSMEPRADEISHSEYNFGPFYYKHNFRYKSALQTNISSIQMYVYASNLNVKVNEEESRRVNLDRNSQTVSVKVARPFIADFPAEALSGTYSFLFNKTEANRIYWNPNSPCAIGCAGTTAETAVKSFTDALDKAQKEGMEIKMTGGVYEIPKEQSIFRVGLELIGNENPFWELTSFSEIPVLNVEDNPIDIQGRSPRRLAGLHITEGENGGLKASTDTLELLGMAFTKNESKDNGGALSYTGKGLFVGKDLLFEDSEGNRGGAAFIDGNADIEGLACANNVSDAEGGCLSVQGRLNLKNAVLYNNESDKSGGAVYARSATVHNATVVGNESDEGNAISAGSGNIYNSVFWKNDGGDASSSISAQYSSFASQRNGTGNIMGDPKFANEKSPGGQAHFFGYDAGLILAKGSPALKGNKDVEGTLELDLLGSAWGNAVAMGAYADYSTDAEFEYGEWGANGKFEPRPDAPVPVFPNLGDKDMEMLEFIGYDAGYGRMIKTHIRKHSKTKVSKATVRITVLDSNFNRYPDMKPVDVVFYRTGEENGKYVFETLKSEPFHPDFKPEEHGRTLLFSQEPGDQGIHGNFLVIHVKTLSDTFRYEVIKW